MTLNSALFRKIDDEYLSTIKELIVKVGVGHDLGKYSNGPPHWCMPRLVYLTPAGVSVLLEVFRVIDDQFETEVDTRPFTLSEITKIRRVIACPHCVGDKFLGKTVGPYTECDHRSIGI